MKIDIESFLNEGLYKLDLVNRSLLDSSRYIYQEKFVKYAEDRIKIVLLDDKLAQCKYRGSSKVQIEKNIQLLLKWVQ